MSDVKAFLAAVTAGHLGIVRDMLRDEPALAAAANDQGVSAPLLAMYYGQGEVAAVLAAHRTDLDIWEAAALGDAGRVGALLASDPAQCDAVAGDGFTPLGLAAFFGRGDVMQALLNGGANPDLAAQNAMRVRPIHSAAANRDPAASLALVDRLLAGGAEVNVAQHGGWTPLHQAADHGNEALVRLLLAHGADPAARSEDGRTPADMAREKGFEAVVALLGRGAGG